MEHELVFDQVMASERALLDPITRSDPHAVERLLAPDFTRIGRSGRLWFRDEIIGSLGGFESSWGAVVHTTQMQGRMLADGLILLTYVSDSEAGPARRSSIWRQTGDHWQAVFHQGTPLPDPEPVTGAAVYRPE
jgi:hypothetical protein